MNKLKTLILGAVLCVGAYAQGSGKSFSTNGMAASTVAVVAGSAVTEYISLSTTSATGAIVKLYNGPTTVSIGAYTNVVRYPTNVVTSSISPSTGLTNTFTNTVQYVGRVLVPANPATPVPPSYIIAVPAAGEIISAEVSAAFPKGIYMENSAAGLTATIFYHLP